MVSKVDKRWKTVDSFAGEIYRFADLLEKHRYEVVALETWDNGKPYEQAANVEIPLVIRTFRYYAGWADKIHGLTVPADGPYHVQTLHEPIGVAGQLVPWNFPLLIYSWKVGPALACGNTMVLKTAELTPLSALYVSKLFLEGQCCCVGSRTFVRESIYNEIIEKAKALALKRVVGDPFKKGVEQGPQINGEQFKKFLNYIRSGVESGAMLEYGGERVGSKGNYIQPTVFSNVESYLILLHASVVVDLAPVVRNKLSTHFNLLRDIKENERLRSELYRTTLYLQLYEQHKKQQKKGKTKTKKSEA
ncbi:hypothetical protein SO802_025161 [Lithocarpus litseifolius]|uniref:aldehyde dehydrogenase (NAD(+)) n=1 Tax=Lithocarpus litseifolius TaxID=425828 RepID=A0AAW2BXR4_9ROSI